MPFIPIKGIYKFSKSQNKFVKITRVYKWKKETPKRRKK